MEFKKLELNQENRGIKGLIKSRHFKKSIISTLVGASLGFGLFFFSEGRYQEGVAMKEIVQSILIGGFFGFFITNSPCARGRC